jgi:hypothetical protein
MLGASFAYSSSGVSAWAGSAIAAPTTAITASLNFTDSFPFRPR